MSLEDGGGGGAPRASLAGGGGGPPREGGCRLALKLPLWGAVGELFSRDGGGGAREDGGGGPTREGGGGGGPARSDLDIEGDLPPFGCGGGGGFE